jgi:transposase
VSEAIQRLRAGMSAKRQGCEAAEAALVSYVKDAVPKRSALRSCYARQLMVQRVRCDIEFAWPRRRA